MFTGLVEEIGIIKSITKGAKSSKITIEASNVLKNVKLGDSICTNGVCLTVTGFDKKSFIVDVMGETMRRSNLSNLKKGEKVNLERAMQVGDRLGGHIVSGHIDGVGHIKEFQQEENAIWITISAAKEVLKYIIYKGSIAIDGVSLTVAYVDDKGFKVSIIPHTQTETTLVKKQIGDVVNLECDMIGKYVERFLSYREDSTKETISMDFLKENGFA
jgi:riboflavin synthase